MIRRLGLSVLVLATALLLVTGGGRMLAGWGGPRDVVLVVVDTLRADALGCYGQPAPTSPHLDALARRGRLYTDVQAPSPWTRPSVATLFTGLSPRRHGVRKGMHRDEKAGRTVDTLPEGVPTLAERMKARGFRTIAIQSNPHCKGRHGFGRGFDEYDEIFWGSAQALVQRAIPHLTEERKEPTFLYLQILDPHTSYKPRLSPVPLPSAPHEITLLELRDSPFKDILSKRQTLADQALATYLSEVFASDQALGRLIRVARRDGSTMIVTSDHGEEFLDHGRFEHGHSLYQELLHVPLLLASPNTSPGLISEPRALADLFEIVTDPFRPRSPSHTPLVSEAILYGPDGISLRRGRYKVTAGLPGATDPRVYDLATDAAEWEPLDPSAPAAGRLERELERYLLENPQAQAGAKAPLDDDTAKALQELGYID